MVTEILHLTDAQVARADHMRARLTEALAEVRAGKRKIARAIKVEIELSDLCDEKGIEGRLVNVSTTGAIIYVKDAKTKQVIEVPNREIVHVEYP